MSSADSDEVSSNLSDSDSDQIHARRNYKTRIDHFNTLDNSEFLIRFRLSKESVQSLLFEIYPYIRVKGTR